MEDELEKLKDQIKSDDWDTCYSAACRIAEISSSEATNILLNMLKSKEPNSRNLAAVAMRNSRNQEYFNPLIARIKELGVDGQIGSLVYALEKLNCSRNLYDIATLNLTNKGNEEIKHSTTVILNEQAFVLTKADLEKVEHLLDQYSLDLVGYDVKFKVRE